MGSTNNSDDMSIFSALTPMLAHLSKKRALSAPCFIAVALV